MCSEHSHGNLLQVSIVGCMPGDSTDGEDVRPLCICDVHFRCRRSDRHLQLLQQFARLERLTLHPCLILLATLCIRFCTHLIHVVQNRMLWNVSAWHDAACRCSQYAKPVNQNGSLAYCRPYIGMWIATGGDWIRSRSPCSVLHGLRT